MRYFNIKLNYKLLHNSEETYLGTCRASVNDKGAIRLSEFQLEQEAINGSLFGDDKLAQLQEIVRDRVRSYLSGDPKFCFIWDENDCIEAYIKEI